MSLPWALVIVAVWPALGFAQQQEPAHPLDIIRAMVDRGEFSDAAEAIAGLPASSRDREQAYLCYRSLDLSQTAVLAERSLRREPNDSEMLRILATAHAMRGDLAAAKQQGERARSALDLDPRLDDPARTLERRRLDDLDRFVAESSTYRARVEEAQGSARIATLATLVIGSAVTFLSLFAAIRR
ncbi:MAG: hypothetical protein JNJ88_12330 [Planctomycetes bacterium]|nr:hypothetical protein [Planctomycetota bacterium]